MGKSTNRGRKTLIDEERGDTILIRTARENRRQRPSEKVDNFNPPPQTKKKICKDNLEKTLFSWNQQSQSKEDPHCVRHQ